MPLERETVGAGKYTKHACHVSPIPVGTVGEFSKIVEEFHEAQDAHLQGDKVMLLIELGDMLGAVERFVAKNFKGVTFDDLVIRMKAHHAAIDAKQRPDEKKVNMLAQALEEERKRQEFPSLLEATLQQKAGPTKLERLQSLARDGFASELREEPPRRNGRPVHDPYPGY